MHKFLLFFCVLLTYQSLTANNTTIKILNERTYTVFKKADVKTSFVCTNPNAGVFGGFGNLMFTVLGVQAMATMLERVPVMNHHLMLNMFEHPDPRQSWNLIPANEFLGLKATVKTRPTRCGDVKNVPFSKTPLKYGTNGCFQAYIGHPEAANVLIPLLPLRYPVENITYYDQMSSQIAQWTFSRPAPIWNGIVDEYRKKVFKPCGDDVTKADLAVQFRTWRDIAGEAATYNQVGGVCVEKCANEMALATQKRLNRPICIYITSDNDTSSGILAESLNALSPGNIHAVYGVQEANAAHWHSVTIVDTARWGSFDPQELRRHQELKDWMLLGEASYALYTLGSTFAITARLRAGLRQQMHDRVPVTAEDGNCTCSNMYPNYHIEHQLHIRERTRRLLMERRRKLQSEITF